MKKCIILSLMLAGLALQTKAKIWRVNNNTGVQADFTQFSTAINSSSVLAGDTIYLEGSATQYDGATITKKLTIIGTGYFLTDTQNPETQWNTNPSVIYSITFNPGSKGSKVSGVYSTSTINLNDSLITVERSYISSYIYFANNNNSFADHDTLRQCYLYGIVSNASSGSAKGLMIYNNIIFGPQIQFQSNLSGTSAYFINNDFVSVYGSWYCENCVFQNNIFRSASFGSYGTSNYFANNLFDNSSSASAVPTGNNNQFSVTLNNVFVGYNSGNFPATGYSHDGCFALASGSPATGAGDINGVTVDAGAFGGPAPYILSGLPSIPSIYSLTVPAQVNNGTPSINISLSAAAH